ncbi:serine O-acetyltransferase EpsC [Allofournierella sp.]|uniref:serine O-acetyltransferase EpsC n=1 Tax=Allofournierella sp. TaxID=1940256 RepID=UPI003AB12FF0
MSLLSDARSIQHKDPAASSLAEVLLLYPGFHILLFHRAAHFFYCRGHRLLARMISQWGRGLTGIEIHPGARIGSGLFIDHGMGVVIGETAQIGANCTIYHQVTLGGTGKNTGKRHPTVGSNVLIGAGCKILGPVTIGDNVRLGAGSVVLKSIPSNSTAIGMPAQVVRRYGMPVRPSDDLNQQDFPDPLQRQLEQLLGRLQRLEAGAGQNAAS